MRVEWTGNELPLAGGFLPVSPAPELKGGFTQGLWFIIGNAELPLLPGVTTKKGRLLQTGGVVLDSGAEITYLLVKVRPTRILHCLGNKGGGGG